MSDYWQMKVTLEFGGKEYIFEDSNYSDGAGCFWWEEGNGACDCNRSLFIKRNCSDSFLEMKCGDQITLKNIELIFQYRKPPRFIVGQGWKDAVR